MSCFWSALGWAGLGQRLAPTDVEETTRETKRAWAKACSVKADHASCLVTCNNTRTQTLVEAALSSGGIEQFLEMLCRPCEAQMASGWFTMLNHISSINSSQQCNVELVAVGTLCCHGTE